MSQTELLLFMIGKIQGIVSPETTNKQELGILMAGGNLGKEKDDV